VIANERVDLLRLEQVVPGRERSLHVAERIRPCELHSLVNLDLMVVILMIIGRSYSRRIIAVGLRPGAAGSAEQEAQGEQPKSNPRHDRSPFPEGSIQPGLMDRPSWVQPGTSGASGFRQIAACHRDLPGGRAVPGQRIEGKLVVRAAGTGSPPLGETGGTWGAKSEVVTVVLGAGVAMAAPVSPGAFAPASRPGLAAGGVGGVGAASPAGAKAGAPVAGRDGGDGAGADEGDPPGPVSGAAVSGAPV
jgi:hypothetical protein